MTQIVESARIHRLMPMAEAEAKAQSLFVALALPDPLRIGRRYPHQVSGRQLQRLLAAMALLTDPKLLIFDEPTTALDVTTQIEVLRAFKKVIRERGATALYVSHDLAVVAQMADRIVVLRDGQIREVGATGRIIDAPRNHYTKALIAAADPEGRANRSRSTGTVQPVAPALEVKGIVTGYGPVDRAGQPASPVLSDISFSIRAGATMGVVGESGCGKSTLARVIACCRPPKGPFCSMARRCRARSANERGSSFGKSRLCSRWPISPSILRRVCAISSDGPCNSITGWAARSVGGVSPNCWTRSSCPPRSPNVIQANYRADKSNG
jgi:peptide/nickel transport system ATP-binding protein